MVGPRQAPPALFGWKVTVRIGFSLFFISLSLVKELLYYPLLLSSQQFQITAILGCL